MEDVDDSDSQPEMCAVFTSPVTRVLSFHDAIVTTSDRASGAGITVPRPRPAAGGSDET